MATRRPFRAHLHLEHLEARNLMTATPTFGSEQKWHNNFSFGSIHPSATNFLFCDASARAISNNTSLGVLLATSSRDGGETQVAE